jgi:hypothetical protein
VVVVVGGITDEDVYLCAYRFSRGRLAAMHTNGLENFPLFVSAVVRNYSPISFLAPYN